MSELPNQSGVNSEALYQRAYDLFQLGQYHNVLPIALQLSAAEPDDCRFHFLAGMSLQLLGECQAAATFYGYVLLLDPDSTPAAFRLAECLLANGEQEKAKVLFESVIEIGRKTDNHFTLQRLAQKNLASLN